MSFGIGTFAAKLLDIAHQEAQDDLDLTEHTDHLHNHLADYRYEFSIEKQDELQEIAIAVENVGFRDRTSLSVSLAIENFELHRQEMDRFQQEFQYIYYAVHGRNRMNHPLLTELPAVHQLSPVDVKIVCGVEDISVPWVKTAIKYFANVLSHYHQPMHQAARDLLDEHRDDYKEGDYNPPLRPNMDGRDNYYSSDDLMEILSQGNYLHEYFDFMTNKDGFGETVANRVAYSPYE